MQWDEVAQAERTQSGELDEQVFAKGVPPEPGLEVAVFLHPRSVLGGTQAVAGCRGGCPGAGAISRPGGAHR